MKKILIMIPFIALISCGESEAEKQKRLSDQLMHNVDSIQKAGQVKIDSLDKRIEASKTADSIADALNKALNGK